MATMGEYVVGAYLKVIEGCDFVDYGARPPGGGLEGLDELDVVGLRFRDRSAFLCEVTTHLHGMGHASGYEGSLKRIRKKHEAQKRYAEKHLKAFPRSRFMLWSPVVPRGRLTSELENIEGLELVINEQYTESVSRLLAEAKKTAADIGNPFFRALQILQHLRRQPGRPPDAV